MTRGDYYSGGFVHAIGPANDPRHPVNVMGRMAQRLACAGWPVWAARKDRPQVDRWADFAVFDTAFHHVSIEAGAAWHTIVAGTIPENRSHPGFAQWRFVIAGHGRNLRRLRRMAVRAMGQRELAGWDGPKRPPARSEAALIIQAVEAWESQGRTETG